MADLSSRPNCPHARPLVRRMRPLSSGLIALAMAGLARADEGMWLLTSPPTAAIKAKYGVELRPEWLTAMQRAAVRFENGGSGSVVSEEGLVMTNHHVGSDMLAKLSTKDRNLMERGYLARTREEELKCPDLELRILWEIEDVTGKVQSAEPDAEKAAQARRTAIAALEKECREKTGMTGQVVTLYQGGKYHLYRYRTFTDVRLVFAPEEAIAFFGGDTDNFEFPRYNLDCCFFRIYQDGKPLKTPDHLRWSTPGTKEGDPVFVFGHPGSTRRAYTSDHLKFLRDTDLPARLNWLHRGEVKWRVFGGIDAEHGRLSREEFLGIQNSRKVYTGLLAGLQDPRLTDAKAEAEATLRNAVAGRPELMAKVGDPWGELAKAEAVYGSFFREKYVYDRVLGAGLLGKATDLVRLASESGKPDGERLPAFREGQRESLLLRLYSPEPVSAAFETEMLTQGLSALAELGSCEDPAVVKALKGVGPAEAARRAIAGTALADPAARRALVEGGAKAIAASSDPLIELARTFEPAAAALDARWRKEVDAPERAAYTKLATARFAVEGEASYPDATFTLRLAYGAVKGIEDEHVPAFTDLGGLYARRAERAGQEGFEIPESWEKAKSVLDLKTPFNLTCDADIIGGNSGSPLVNAKGEVVGLIFDGNVYSLVGNVAFDAGKSRALAVDSRGMLEAFRKVYRAEELVRELVK